MEDESREPDVRRDSQFSLDHFNRHSDQNSKLNHSFIARVKGRFETIKEKIPRVFQLLMLYFALGALAAAGGVIFKMCERGYEQNELDRKRQIWNDLLENGNFTESQLNNDVRVWSDNYAQAFVDANKWEFHYSVFFAATTFTTCGFGLQAPRTVLGKLFVIIYGLPAIMMYGVIAKKVGLLCMYFIRKFVIKCGVSSVTYAKHRLKFIGAFFCTVFVSMSFLIQVTAQDEGFGHGIHSFYDAVYFLYTTTTTIGYGDVMMSGSNPFLTVIIGLWLASTLGLAICFAQEVGAGLTGVDDFVDYPEDNELEVKKLSIMKEIDAPIKT